MAKNEKQLLKNYCYDYASKEPTSQPASLEAIGVSPLTSHINTSSRPSMERLAITSSTGGPRHR
jgi:hypothetical protein